MSKYPRFDDFLEEKKKLMNVKDDGLTGDVYDGPLETKPNKGNPKDVNSLSPPLKNLENPDDKHNVVWMTRDGDPKKGLPFSKTPSLTPKNSFPGGVDPESKTEMPPEKKKLTSEEFIGKTKKMNSAEFARFMLEHQNAEITAITDLYGNEFTPDPTQSIQYVAGLLMGNGHLMERFIREVKRREGLHHLVEEILEQPEAYEIMVEAMQDGEAGKDRCHKLARSMNDGYMAMIDNIGYLENVNEEVGPGLKGLGLAPQRRPSGANPPVGQQNGQLGMPPQKKPGGTFGGGFGPGNEPNPEHAGNAWRQPASDFGGGSAEAPGQASVRPGGGPGNTPTPMTNQGRQPNFGQGNIQAPNNKPKGVAYMGESASGNLIESMAGHKALKERMIHHCKNGEC